MGRIALSRPSATCLSVTIDAIGLTALNQAAKASSGSCRSFSVNVHTGSCAA
jgi:hypothetical protein